MDWNWVGHSEWNDFERERSEIKKKKLEHFNQTFFAHFNSSSFEFSVVAECCRTFTKIKNTRDKIEFKISVRTNIFKWLERHANCLIDFYGDSKRFAWDEITKRCHISAPHKIRRRQIFSLIFWSVFLQRNMHIHANTIDNSFFLSFEALVKWNACIFFFVALVKSLKGSNYDILWKWIWFNVAFGVAFQTTKRMNLSINQIGINANDLYDL